jgi:hypothetical protein
MTRSVQSTDWPSLATCRKFFAKELNAVKAHWTISLHFPQPVMSPSLCSCRTTWIFCLNCESSKSFGSPSSSWKFKECHRSSCDLMASSRDFIASRYLLLVLSVSSTLASRTCWFGAMVELIVAEGAASEGFDLFSLFRVNIALKRSRFRTFDSFVDAVDPVSVLGADDIKRVGENWACTASEIRSHKQNLIPPTKFAFRISSHFASLPYRKTPTYRDRRKVYERFTSTLQNYHLQSHREM